jgi:hypothetical protein
MRLKKEYEARKAAQKSRQEQTASEHERAAHEAELAKERFWKHPDKIARYTGWLSWYTFALFVATLFLFFTAVITACILHRTDESIRLQTRSNLVFNKVVFPRDSDRFALQDGSRYRNFLTVWTNAGNTPTERTIIRVGCSNIPWSFVDNTERRNNWLAECGLSALKMTYLGLVVRSQTLASRNTSEDQVCCSYSGKPRISTLHPPNVERLTFVFELSISGRLKAASMAMPFPVNSPDQSNREKKGGTGHSWRTP